MCREHSMLQLVRLKRIDVYSRKLNDDFKSNRVKNDMIHGMLQKKHVNVEEFSCEIDHKGD